MKAAESFSFYIFFDSFVRFVYKASTIRRKARIGRPDSIVQIIESRTEEKRLYALKHLPNTPGKY